MSRHPTIGDSLRKQGLSRREFLKFCATAASLMALPPSMIPRIAEALENTPRQSVIWLSFQECTGCTESLTRAHVPSIENLIFNTISLDYHHTLQAASGDFAEKARAEAMKANHGNYLLVVDGSIPLGNPGYSTIAGISNQEMLQEVASGAKAIIAMGTCAAFGGLPYAYPNPTGAVSVQELIRDKPIVNVPGCPPIPVVISSIVAHYVTLGTLPQLDSLKRPMPFYGQNIHDRCYRRHFYHRGKFAETFDDEGAKQGWCLYKLGCKGPVTYNACAVLKWNDATSFPIESGHGCLGCSEPNFWDAGSFYKALSIPTAGVATAASYATVGGAAIGVVAGIRNRQQKTLAQQQHQTVTVDDLERK